MLGVADEQLLASALDAVASGDARAALLAVARCAEGGRDASSFTRDLEGRARELLVVQTLGCVPPELSLTPEIDERLREQAARIGPAEVVRLLDLLGAALEAVRAGADPRTQLELALVKAAAPAADGSTRALLARIERLEQALAGSAPLSAPSPPGASASVAPGSSPASPAPASPPRTAAPSAPSAPSSPLVSSPSSPPAQSDAASEQPMSQPAAETSEQESVAAPVAVLALPGPSDLEALWAAVHESVRAEHGLLGAVLNEATPATLTEEELLLAFPPTAAFHKRKAEDPANRSTLIETLRRLTGRHYRLGFELRDDLRFGCRRGRCSPERGGDHGAFGV